MKIFKNINYRLVRERLVVACLSVKLIHAIIELLNMAFNYLKISTYTCSHTKGGFQNLK
jgi:hypothetical protein